MSFSITSSPVPPGTDLGTGVRTRSSLAKMPSKQHINTSFASLSTQGLTASPGAPSLSTSSTNTSIQSSPEGPRGRNFPFMTPPPPLQLPETTLPSPVIPIQSAMSELVFPSTKGPSLIRRISGKVSGKATNRFVRRRQSSNNVTSRDHSSGPVILRRRSGSKTGPDLVAGHVDPDVEGDDEEAFEEPLPIFGLGLMTDGVSSAPAPSPQPASCTEHGIGPVVPGILRTGSTLTKVTRKKKKTLTFYLDVEKAKVYWNPSNPSKRFYIDDIEQIRSQSTARIYREELQVSAEAESRWFTIIYADPDNSKGRQCKTMHLVAPNQHLFELWTSTLEDVREYRRDLMAGLARLRQRETILHYHWNYERAKRLGGNMCTKDAESLDLIGVGDLCRSLHINVSKDILRARFEEADSSNTGALSFGEFKDFVRRLKERSDVKEIYDMLTSHRPDGLDLDAFLDFLRDTQGIEVDANTAHWRRMFNKFLRRPLPKTFAAPEISGESALRMGYDAFSTYLQSADNSVLDTKRQTKTLDTKSNENLETKLDRPLNEYFVSSSHNTYLLGRQVAGSSSTEAYIRALQHACRCVEIDCWDGPDGRPMVSHGRTMTTKVLFADCVSVIAQYAFDASEYPLTLSLEVHCNPVQQQTMVDIMKRDLREWLVQEPYMTNAFVLPSPEDLKRKILIKVKPGGEPMEADRGSDLPINRPQRSVSSPYARPQILNDTFVPNGLVLSSPPSVSPPEFPSPVWGPSRGSTTATSMSSASDDSDGASPSKSMKSQKKKTKHRGKIIKSLGDLGVYTRGLKYRDFNLPESKTYNHIFSLAERTFEGICRDPEATAQLEKHNMRCLMRVYPSAFRLKSTNPDPLAFWRRGVQMVALNWQTRDLGMQINEAMFASGSDRTGYVLKPDEMRHSILQEPTSETSNPKVIKAQKKLIRFSIEVISAQQLPLPRSAAIDDILDPYVEIEMFSAEEKSEGFVSGEGGSEVSKSNGTSSIFAAHRRRTDIVPSNGFNPIFKDAFKFSLETKYPSLVFVRWTVWHSPDGRSYNTNNNAEPLATFTAKLSSLRQGFRHLPLYDHNGDRFIFATLFCKITKEEPITVDREDPVAEKSGRFGRLGIFKRTMSVERKNSSKTD